jgi:hypothetical protein
MPFHLVLAYAPFRGAKSRQHKRAHSHDASGYAHSGWATRDAAEAAKSDFKAWVERGMHAGQRAGAAASAAARSAASSAGNAPAEARRSSQRIPANREWCAALRLTVQSSIDCGACVAASVAPTFAPMGQIELAAAWRRRSAGVLTAAAKRKRQHDAASEARARLPIGVWDDFLERCRVAAAIDEASGLLHSSKRLRGPGRQWLIGQRRQLKPIRHVQRREQQAKRQRERQRAAETYRKDKIALLCGALMSNNCASFIDSGQIEGAAAPSAPLPPQTSRIFARLRLFVLPSLLLTHSVSTSGITLKQVGHVASQCWVVLKVYEEMGRPERAVLEDGALVPAGGISKAASCAAVSFFGFDAMTVTSWRLECK